MCGEKTPSHILVEYDKTLTYLDCRDFQSAIHHSDFWGLNSDNSYSGCDGSTLQVYGIRTNPRGIKLGRQKNYVYRWCGGNLIEPFELAVKFAGNKHKCCCLN